MTLDTLVQAYRNGATADEIASAYDSLDLADVHTAIGFYLRYQSVVEEYLRQRAELGEMERRNRKTRSPSGELRARLLARRARAS